jgi:CspA family cold shock protein
LAIWRVGQKSEEEKWQMVGTVKFYNEAKGFGFIAPDDGGKDIFVHITSCADVEALTEGQRVRYDERVGKRSGKPEAYAVAPI